MDIKLFLEPMEPAVTALAGGGYAESSTEIHIDEHLPRKDQRDTAIHEVVESFNPAYPHDVVDQLTGAIAEALDQLEEAWKSTLSENQPPDRDGDVNRFADTHNP